MPSTSTDTTTPTATDTPNATPDATPTPVPQRLAFRLDDTAIALDALNERLEVIGHAHVGVRMRDAYNAAQRIAVAAEASGTPATAGQVLEPLARALFYDPLGYALDALADEIAETARALRSTATEAGVSLSTSYLDTLPK